MKNFIKRLVHFVNEDCLKLYLLIFYKWQIKKKFMKNTDSIDEIFKQNIENYWEKYQVKVSKDWHKWYSSRNGIKDVRYIPEDLFYTKIERFLNKVDFKEAYADKALHSIWFPNVKRPKVISKNLSGVNYDDKFNIISQDEVLQKCIKSERIIIKPTIDSGGGRDICFVDSKEVNNMYKEVLSKITEFKQNYIIQEIIEQHEDLKRINPESINTIRAMSLLLNGEVHVFSSRLRMGINGSKVDNATTGGLSCGINPDGSLNEVAYDNFGNPFKTHPQGFVFEGSKVPSFKKMIDIIKKEHIKFGHFKLISWDFAIDNEGNPLLIEVNLRFQGINGGQLCNGPLFGDLTDSVLELVFGAKQLYNK